MKKKGLFISLLLILILAVPVQAQTSRANVDRATLSFDGTTANCRVQLTGNLKDKISATIKLCSGSQTIQTWYESSTAVLSFYDTVTVEKGKSYTLTVDYTVAGKSKPTLSTSGTCK